MATENNVVNGVKYYMWENIFGTGVGWMVGEYSYTIGYSKVFETKDSYTVPVSGITGKVTVDMLLAASS